MKRVFLLWTLVLGAAFSCGVTCLGEPDMHSLANPEILLDAFYRTHSKSALRSAFYWGFENPELLKNKEAQIEVLFRIYAAGLEALDPFFDAEKCPVSMNVAPPAVLAFEDTKVSSGIALNPGRVEQDPAVDGCAPTAIKDPIRRAEYERAIQRNNELIEYRYAQLGIRNELNSLKPVILGMAQRLPKNVVQRAIEKSSTDEKIRRELATSFLGAEAK